VTFRQCRNQPLGIAVTFALVAMLPTPAGGVLDAQQFTPAGQAPAIPVEVVVVDRDGKPADTLTPDSFTVTVDGKPRRVLWVRHVSRGPGASDEAARRLPGRTDTLSFAAEPARNVLVVVDQYSIRRGSERIVNQAAWALVDRLGLDDRVGVLRVPVARDRRLSLTTERPDVRDALRQIVGEAPQIAGSAASLPPDPQPALGTDPNRVTMEPDRAVMVEPERPAAGMPTPGRGDEDTTALQRGFLPNLQSVLNGLRESPGRKIIAIFSGGAPEGPETRVDDAARAAVAAHATIYAVGLPGARDDVANPLDVGALEHLATATGGTFTMLGKNADKSLERVMPELSACYVLGIEPGPADTAGSRHRLRVETPRQPFTVRAPGWLIPRQDIDDLVPAAAPPPRLSGAAAPVVVTDGASKARAARSVKPSPRDVEAQRLVARAANYIAGYQREYSLLVAEETYVQSTRDLRQQTRSDLLLVRREHADGWVSFRDVYEVNGQAVRDHDDRLKRLFLDPGTDAEAQLALILSESARYNIGPIARNINVPLFATKFLENESLWRCSFKVGGAQAVGGVVSTRLEYEETGRPTLVRDNKVSDIAATGWFLIDPASGAITGSRMRLKSTVNGSFVEFDVKYERDATLGLWVPREMTEVYTRTGLASGGNTVTLDALATYAKFRRFQVKSETEIKIAK